MFFKHKVLRKYFFGIFLLLLIYLLIYYLNDMNQNPSKSHKSLFGERTNSIFFNKLRNLNISNKETYVNNPKAYDELQNSVVDIMTNISERKRILYWYRPWGSPVQLHILPPKCGKCEVTDDTSKLNDTDTAAVVFHITEINYDTIPKTRNPDHYYVYHVAEGPQYIRFAVHKEFLEFDNFFNLTMSYRRNSDIFSSYDKMSHVLDQLKQKYKDTNDSGISATLKMKTRFAVWLVSNCDLTPGARERLDIVEEMVKSGIPVDRRGRCFPKNKPPPGERSNYKNDEQLKFFGESKFILSFENSHNCKDYFTEKLFWNGFIAGALPIIWGAPKEDYEKVIPPHSAIFLDDYPNLKDLAAYLNYLDKNETAYREYFEWRLMDVEEMSDYDRKTSLCQLCRVVHGVNIDNLFSPNVPRLQKIPLFGFPEEPRIVKSIHEWEFGDKNKRCFEFPSKYSTAEN